MSHEQIATQLLQQLESGWNAADGEAFAAPFTEDADFVAIRGDHHRTRDTIARGHTGIFNSIYKGSTIRYELMQVRPLTDDVLLVHSRGTLNAPSGPLAGTHQAYATLVLVRRGDGWQVASFHNTMIQSG